MEYMRQFDRGYEKDSRRRQPLFAWTRPTIAWDLECEADPEKSRETVMWTFSHPFSMPTRVKVSLAFAYTVLAVESICLCCAGCLAMKEGESGFATGGRAIATVCGCGFVANVVWMLATAVGMQDTNIETLENYSVINGCSDQYTHVPVEDMTVKINSSTSSIKIASYISYGLLVLYTIACIVVTKQTVKP